MSELTLARGLATISQTRSSKHALSRGCALTRTAGVNPVSLRVPLAMVDSVAGAVARPVPQAHTIALSATYNAMDRFSMPPRTMKAVLARRPAGHVLGGAELWAHKGRWLR